MYVWHKTQTTEDPYGLDGNSYGLMNWEGGGAGRAMMAGGQTAGGKNALPAKSMPVMATSNNSSQLFVPNESDISMWTFHWIDDDYYYITTVENGSTKYLKVDSNGLTLVSDQEEASEIQVVPGTGTREKQICLKVASGADAGTTVTFTGKAADGFSVGGGAGSEWFYLVSEEELTDEYMRTYSATKVSVSDPGVTNGSKIIIYTRVWNEDKMRYDFYAIDHDGTLRPVYENGNRIEWVDGQINKLLWDFVEYPWEGTDAPNYYYEFYNEFSKKFLVPQAGEGGILTDEPIGIPAFLSASQDPIPSVVYPLILSSEMSIVFTEPYKAAV